jgi:ABC-type antimicrobial peptide transport system permease subunit
MQEIVGIVADVRHYGLSRPITYQMYEPFAQRAMSSMTIVVRGTGDPAAMVPDIRARLAAVDAEQPLGDVKPMSQIVSESVARQRFAVVLLSIFAGVALLLAIVGIYGVISDAVTQRTREIGIRLALGARSSDCIRLMMRQGILPVAIGLVVGLAGAFAASRVIASLLYEVSATDPTTLGGVTALIGGVALVASYLPARRVTRVDPMVALRSE